MLLPMDKELLLERLKELSSGFTQLASEYPFETGILLGALGMAIVWWVVSLTTGSRGSKNTANTGGSRRANKLAIEDVREKARRRL